MPNSYTGPCLPFANLIGLTEAEKAHYATLCDVQFPCSAPAIAELCEPVDAPCPIGWDYKGSEKGVCHSSEYTGPCRPLIFVDQIQANGKSSFMEMCDVLWACKQQQADRVPATGQPSSILHSGPINADGRIAVTNY